MNLIERTRVFLSGRAGAYRAVFQLPSPPVETVLADLARFCRANESTGHLDTHVAARLDGRREVWLRIQQHLRLTDEQLWQLFGGGKT